MAGNRSWLLVTPPQLATSTSNPGSQWPGTIHWSKGSTWTPCGQWQQGHSWYYGDEVFQSETRAPGGRLPGGLGSSSLWVATWSQAPPAAVSPVSKRKVGQARSERGPWLPNL